jgi:hypothetical protein
MSSNVEVLLATKTTVLAVDALGVQDQLISNGPFTKMSVSPNGKLLACFSETGVLWVVLSDFSKNVSQFDTKSKVRIDYDKDQFHHIVIRCLQTKWYGVVRILWYYIGILSIYRSWWDHMVIG